MSPVLTAWYESDLRKESMVYKMDEAFSQGMLDQLTEAVYSLELDIAAERVPVWIQLADFLDVSFLEFPSSSSFTTSCVGRTFFGEDVPNLALIV